jgi:hypothetical protein
MSVKCHASTKSGSECSRSVSSLRIDAKYCEQHYQQQLLLVSSTVKVDGKDEKSKLTIEEANNHFFALMVKIIKDRKILNSDSVLLEEIKRVIECGANVNVDILEKVDHLADVGTKKSEKTEIFGKSRQLLWKANKPLKVAILLKDLNLFNTLLLTRSDESKVVDAVDEETLDLLFSCYRPLFLPDRLYELTIASIETATKMFETIFLVDDIKCIDGVDNAGGQIFKKSLFKKNFLSKNINKLFKDSAKSESDEEKLPTNNRGFLKVLKKLLINYDQQVFNYLAQLFLENAVLNQDFEVVKFIFLKNGCRNFPAKFILSTLSEEILFSICHYQQCCEKRGQKYHDGIEEENEAKKLSEKIKSEENNFIQNREEFSELLEKFQKRKEIIINFFGRDVGQIIISYH